MARLLSALVYLLVFLPIWLFRGLTGTSRFGRRIHATASAWDRPRTLPERVSPAVVPQASPLSQGSKQGA
jgi:hypothetical protein